MKIIYSEDEYWNFVLKYAQQTKTIRIATFGFYAGLDKQGWFNNYVRKVLDCRVPIFDLLIGLIPANECTPGCPECVERNKISFQRLLLHVGKARDEYGINVKVTSQFHAKLVVMDKIAITGGRNFTGSGWTDLSFVHTDKHEVKQMRNVFRTLWEESPSIQMTTIY